MATISVAGQYFLSISNVTFSPDQLKSLRLFEYSGLRLPQAELIFETADAEQRAVLYVGVIITIALSFGREDTNTPLSFRVVDTASSPRGDGTHVIRVTLEQSLPEFTEHALSSSVSGTSLAAISSIIPKGIIEDNQAKGANDSQVWIRPMQTARDFAEDVWLRSRINQSTLLMAFTVNGEFRLRDTLSIRQRGGSYDFRVLAAVSDTSRDIAVSGSLSEKSASGVLSYIAASGRMCDFYSLSAGVSVPYKASTTLEFLSSRPVLEISNPNTNAIAGQIYDNTHAETPQAILDNKANLARLSTVEVPVHTTGRYIPVHPLDLVLVLEPHSSGVPFIEAGSGLYIATTVIREINEDRKLNTTVILGRESRNGAA